MLLKHAEPMTPDMKTQRTPGVERSLVVGFNTHRFFMMPAITAKIPANPTKIMIAVWK
jgi:hypothetical protein